ncbi:hypothetical protein BN14_07204 [Rhizoctonia solani AG-1 IB]|uniref:Uncharacterized protein n=1 Tax=Thanatephorus cucumeris (strain AG1-IB / isolate 7/3/14) TaxID=1108050 RepID=M5BZP8_THACB|nr:hypothetical protein BN14_07204 [Rhizoctonia solani AG-1 IB]
MQYRSRAVAPSSPSATPSSVRSSASSSVHSDDGASSSSLIYHSEEEQEDLGDPNHRCAQKPKKVKAPKQKTVKVELPVDATATGAQPRESSSRLRRLCKAIVPGSKA